jgi:hypothetical protein
MPTLSAQEIQSGLSQFIGSEEFYRISAFTPWLIATEGVKWLADNAECWWLVDAIASHQLACRKDEALKFMQFWTLKTDLAVGTGVLTCERDAGDIAITQHIDYTDFPLPEIRIWVEGVWGQQMTMMLPGER